MTPLLKCVTFFSLKKDGDEMSICEGNNGVDARAAMEAAEDAALEEFLKRYPGHERRSTPSAKMWTRVVTIFNQLQLQRSANTPLH